MTVKFGLCLSIGEGKNLAFKGYHSDITLGTSNLIR